MTSHEIYADFVAEIAVGHPVNDACAAAKEVAKKIVPYKRFGTMKTTAYVFWDGSAFLVGEQGAHVMFSAGKTYEELDEVVLTGTWD